MKKLEEYRDKEAYEQISEYCQTDNHSFDCECPALEEGYKTGFNAAILLHLPVEFYDWFVAWKATELAEYSKKYGNKRQELQDGEAWLAIAYADTKKMYQYWIDNIYKPK